jgi:porin
MARTACGLGLLSAVIVGGSAFGQVADGDGEESSGIIPIPDYSGGPWDRTHLLGDFDGGRDGLAEKGIQLHVDWTQHLQSVVDGGRDETTRYGTSLDYVMTLDLHRMGLLPGAIVGVRAESILGSSVNRSARTILPVNTDLAFPLSGPGGEDVDLALTELTYTQFLSEHVALFMGKLNTLGGDPNEFASGRGMFQFSNSDFVFNPVTALTVPYSTLGAGILWIPSENLTIVASVFNTVDASTTSGFDDFGDGWTLSVEAQTRHQLHGLPGGQNFGFVYADDGNYLRITGRLTFEPGVGLEIPRSDDSYALYWSGWQYLWTAEADDSPIDTSNGRPDRRGIGVCARSGFGDDDTLPVEWHVSGGIGGRGLIPGRPDDHFGIGYGYSAISNGRLSGLTGGGKGEAQGAEAFYSIAVSPSAAMSFSAQAYDDVNRRSDTSIILGARLNIRF